MATIWTPEQLRAIEARGDNLLLSAAAGSGKTTVLVERVLRLITDDNASIDRMLIVTFTRAAASDMRTKLSKKLSAQAAEGNSLCREQMIRLEHASITTLHAFCADFLRTHFEIAGVDPAFRILDDPVQLRLMDDALDEILEQAYSTPDADLLALDYGRGPKDVRSLVSTLCRILEERPDPDAWLARAAACDDTLVSAWLDELARAARRTILQTQLSLIQALNVPNCPPQYAAAIEKDLEQIDILLSAHDYDSLLRAVQDFRFARVSGGKRGSADESAKEAVSRLRDAAKDAFKTIRLSDFPTAQAISDARSLAPQLAALGRLAKAVSERFEEKKAEQSGLSYSDLERRTLIALQDEDTARAVRERFDYVFVDEYQDTSDIQEAIVSRICRPDNRFMVGDVKQSIYRFRLAEPRLFIDKYAAYMHGHGGQLLPLTRNFRSRPTILNFVNMVFERVMTGGDAEIEYDELARLNPGLPQDDPGAPVEIHLLERSAPEGGDVDEAIAELKSAEREGLFIARKIRAMMDADPSLRYRDFAILTRAKASAFTPMAPMLLAENIPAYADGATGYFDTVEVLLALSLLRLIANLRSDIELIGVLHSPVAGLSADDLAQIRIAHRDMPFVDAAWRFAYGAALSDGEPPAENLPDSAIARRLRGFFDMLRSWRLRCGAISLGLLVRAVLEESGFYVYAGALPGGAQRQANLDRLVDVAERFDSDISGSIVRFLKHTERLKAKGDGDAAHLLGENDDVVRMMTIHKSKGLEFRVVFGALLCRTYSGARPEPLSAHRDLGLGMAYMDPSLRTRRKTLPQAAIDERRKREDAAEEMRILYVLMTRAQERLLLVGSVRDADKALQRWDALSHAVQAASSHMDLIMAARTAALRDGAALYSTLELHSIGELSAISPAAHDPRALCDEISASPERFADPILDEELLWHYPDALGAQRPLKLTVSSLLREVQGPNELPEIIERPLFMAEDAPQRMTAAERGTAYHRAIQMLDLAPLRGLSGRSLVDAIRTQLNAFALRRILSEAQHSVIRPSQLASFFASDVGQRLLAASEVHREWSFNVLMRASEALTPDEAGPFSQDEILVQGTIDCCFLENDAWVLLDFKTDNVTDPQILIDRYAPQLRLYALALERITSRPVSQTYLCGTAAYELLPR